MPHTVPLHRASSSDTLTIHNDGPRITYSSYWSSALAASKLLFVSFSAGTCRVLIPAGFDRELLKAARTSREVLVTRASEPSKHAWRYSGPFALELLWEDDSTTPYSLCVSLGQLDRLPPASQEGCGLPVSIWGSSADGQPQQLHEQPGRYRVASRLPYMRPWGR